MKELVLVELTYTIGVDLSVFDTQGNADISLAVANRLISAWPDGLIPLQQSAIFAGFTPADPKELE